jgi:hypothetical protein
MTTADMVSAATHAGEAKDGTPTIAAAAIYQ